MKEKKDEDKVLIICRQISAIYYDEDIKDVDDELLEHIEEGISESQNYTPQDYRTMLFNSFKQMKIYLKEFRGHILIQEKIIQSLIDRIIKSNKQIDISDIPLMDNNKVEFLETLYNFQIKT